MGFGEYFINGFFTASKRLSLCLSVRVSVCVGGVLWLNGWMDQDETWLGGRPRPRPRYVR